MGTDPRTGTRHRPKERLTFFAGVPSVATGGLSAAEFVAASLTEVTSCMPARGPNTPAESRDRISISANRRKQNPFEHPAGSSEGCGLKTTRLEVDAPAALAFNKAERAVRAVLIVSRLGSLSYWGQVLSLVQWLWVSLWKNNP